MQKRGMAAQKQQQANVQESRYTETEMDKVRQLLSQFNIEVRIRTRQKEPIFEYRSGQGNLGTGLLITDKVLFEKLGVDLVKYLKSLDNDRMRR